MRVFKSVGINFNNLFLLFVLGAVAMLFVDDGSGSGVDHYINIINENYLIVIIFLISVCVLTINEVVADRTGITKKLYIVPLLSKTKTWKEIKCYAHVKEVYDGEHGEDTTEALWFIDYNDKVCLRIPKSGRLNMSDVMKIIEKFEDQHEVSLEIKNPYLMSKGWSKVDYTSTKKSK